MKHEGIELLLVEDSVADAELALHALTREHLVNRIHVAQDGEEALDFLFCRGEYTDRSFDSPPRLVLLDLNLPKISGLQVLQAIKADPRTRVIPIAVLTSSKEERDLIQSYQLGVNSYIQKPVDFDQFRATIRSLGYYWLVVNQPPPRAAITE